MGDLLKTMRSSQIFSVTGLPDVVVTRFRLRRRADRSGTRSSCAGWTSSTPRRWRWRTSPATTSRRGSSTRTTTSCASSCRQAFFPRTSAWDSLQEVHSGEYEDSVWEHLAGTTSAPFVPGEHRKVAVKVIDDRGNELLVVKSLDEAS